MQTQLHPMVIHPRPSRELALWLGCLQLSTLVVLLAAPLPAASRVLLAVLWLTHSLATQWRLHGASGRRILRLRLDQAGEARLQLADGRVLRSRLRDDSLVTPWWLLLRFEEARPWGHRSLLLGRDSLSPEQARRLRLLLRFGQRARRGGPHR